MEDGMRASMTSVKSACTFALTAVLLVGTSVFVVGSLFAVALRGQFGF